MKLLTAFIGLTTAFAFPYTVHAGGDCEPALGFCEIEAVAITGNNNRLGRTVFSFEHVGAVTFGQFVGVRNPGGALPFVIDASTPDDAVLVSIAPPGFPLYRANAPSVPFQNLPFQDVPTIVNPAGGIGTLPHNSTVPATVRSSGVGKVDYTLGQGLEAEGEISLWCRNDGTTKLRAEFENLVPNGGI